MIDFGLILCVIILSATWLFKPDHLGAQNCQITLPFPLPNVNVIDGPTRQTYVLSTTNLASLRLLTSSLDQEPESLNSLKMEVGIEDCLHIEFEYDKSAYHLQDVVIGKVRVNTKKQA